MIFEIIDVECYCGYKKDEKPISFYFQDQHWKIKEIIDRWYDGGINPKRQIFNYFKVMTENEKIFILRYNPDLRNWAVQVF